MVQVQVGDVRIAVDQPLTIIAGPCVAESLEMCLRVGEALRDRCQALGLQYIFKASFDKANRSSIRSYRGQGLEDGLQLFEQIKSELGVPLTTDIHEPAQASLVATTADLLQIPAFLCRQTDLLVAAANTGRPVNVKKGQFISPDEMKSVVEKLTEAHAAGIMLTERGTFFGYNRLVNDFIGLGDLMDLGHPVCFDVTHSTQLPGGGARDGARVTAGRPDRAPLLARCAVAAGVPALFIETHPDPVHALSDAGTQLPIETTLLLLDDLARLAQTVRGLS